MIKYNKKIAQEVIDHWAENLFLAYAHQLNYEDILATKCAFCKAAYQDCRKCPICCFPIMGARMYCKYTPFSFIDDSVNTYPDTRKNWKRIIKYVTQELNFLQEVCDGWKNHTVYGIGDETVS